MKVVYNAEIKNGTEILDKIGIWVEDLLWVYKYGNVWAVCVR